MNIPVPKAADALNRLAMLDLGDADAAMQIYFGLRGLAAARPGDVDLRTAMAHACQIIGYRDEAVDHLLAADALWGSADLATRSRIICLLSAFCFSDRALKRARSIVVEIPNLPAAILNNCGLVAIQFGDLDFIKLLTSRISNDPIVSEINNSIILLDEIGIYENYGYLQKIVNAIIIDFAIEIELGFPVHPDDGLSYFKYTIQIDGSKIHRFDLSDQINDALESFASQHLAHMPDWWWRYSVDLRTAPRHSSLPAKPRLRTPA